MNLEIAKWLFIGGLGCILLPPFGWKGLGVNMVARGLWLLSGIITWKENKKIRKSGLLKWFGVFFGVMSLSVVVAGNGNSFLKAYEDFAFGGLVFGLGYVLLDEEKWRKRVMGLLVGMAVVDLVIQIGMLIMPSWIKVMGRLVWHQGFYELVKINLDRRRLYLESFDEVLLPFLWVKLGEGKRRWWWGGLIVGIMGMAFLSNFRTRFVMAGLGVGLGMGLVLSKRRLKMIGVILGLGGMMLGLGARLTWEEWGFNVVDRLMMKDEQEDVLSVKGRWRRWWEAVEMGKASWLGVGLGNYYDNISWQLKSSVNIIEEQRKEFEAATHNPHNVFMRVWAEGGWGGVLAWSGLLIYLGKQDWLLWKNKRDKMGLSWGMGFWLLVIYTLFNPGTTLKYWSLFWLLRLLRKDYSI